METDITLVFLKYLVKYNRIDIKYLDSLNKNRFKGSNIHKLVTHLCINYINLKSEIKGEDLRMYLNIYRNSLVHCEGSTSDGEIKTGIITILEEIDRLKSIEEYDENNYMMY